MARAGLPLVVSGLLLAVLGVGLAAVLLLDEGPEQHGSGGGPVRVRSSAERGMSVPPPEVERPDERSPLASTASSASASLEAVAAGVAPGPGREVSGQLLRRSDLSAIAHASVRGQLGSCTSDGQGRFRFAGVQEDERDLLLLLGARPFTLQLPDTAGDVQGAEFVVDTGFRIDGSVTDSLGAPVVDAEVKLTDARSSQVLAAAASDGAGRFVLLDVPPLHLARVAARGAWHSAAQVSLLLGAGGDERWRQGVDLALPAGGQLRGRVFDGNGVPLPGVTVMLPALRDPQGVPAWRDSAPAGVTDSMGLYSIRGLLPGDYVALLGLSPSPGLGDEQAWQGVRELHESVVIVEGQFTELDFVLPDPASLAGRVVDRGGGALPGAPVKAWLTLSLPSRAPAGNSWTGHFSGGYYESQEVPGGSPTTLLALRVGVQTTVPSGAFQLPGMPQGVVHLVADLPGARPAGLTVSSRSGQRQEGLLLVVGAGLTLTGRVLLPDGQPARDATVFAAASSDVLRWDDDDFLPVDGSGRFSIDGLLPGPHTLLARCDGHLDERRSVESGQQGIELTLRASTLLRGTVADGASGDPLDAFWIRVEDDQASYQGNWSGTAGRFLYDTLPEGTYTVSAFSEGYADELREGVLLRAGSPVEIDFLMRRP